MSVKVVLCLICCSFAIYGKVKNCFIKYWRLQNRYKIYSKLYSNQQGWVKGSSFEEVNENLKKFLRDEAFDIDFEKCINDKEIEDFILNDRIEGTKKFKVNATPTIIINNEKFEKSLNYKNLKKTIEKLI